MYQIMISVNIFKDRNLISALSLFILDSRTFNMKFRMGSFICSSIFQFDDKFSLINSRACRNSSAPQNEYISHISIKDAMFLMKSNLTILFLTIYACCRSRMMAMYTKLPCRVSNSVLLIFLSNSEGLAALPPLSSMFSSSDIVWKIDGIISSMPTTKHWRQH